MEIKSNGKRNFNGQFHWVGESTPDVLWNRSLLTNCNTAEMCAGWALCRGKWHRTWKPFNQNLQYIYELKHMQCILNTRIKIFTFKIRRRTLVCSSTTASFNQAAKIITPPLVKNLTGYKKETKSEYKINNSTNYQAYEETSQVPT